MDDIKPDYDGAKVIALGELKARLAYLEERFKGGEPDEEADVEVWEEWEELEVLRGIAGDLSWCWNGNGNGDATSLISERHWSQFCRDKAYDLGELRRGGWMESFVDWDKFENHMQQDYMEVVLPDSNSFFVRK